jgi:hypothetical protein
MLAGRHGMRITGGCLLQREALEAARPRVAADLLSESLLDSLVNIAVKYQDRIDRAGFLPRVDWRRPRNDRRTETIGAATAR